MPAPVLADFPKTLVRLRNIGIIAHIDAGKTTLTERILFYTRKIHRMGEVHEGAATMDFMPEEQERGITIASACCSCVWRGHNINIIDTPGHVDFSIEVERCLRVLDGAIGVFCAVGGVEPQSETVWRQAESFGTPRLAFINKMDRPGASFSRTVDELRDRLGARPVPVTLPLGEEEYFTALLDLLVLERIDFDPESQGREYRRTPLNQEETALAAPWREKLLEAAADESDLVMEQYLAGETPAADLLRAALRKGVLAKRIVPVYAGAALRNIGVQPLLDGVVDFLPSPAESLPASAEIPVQGQPANKINLAADPEAPLAALVFKVFLEGGRKLSLLRLYAGSIREGTLCCNALRGEAERVTRIFRLEADARIPLNEAGPGDIVAVQGLRSVFTGDTITSRDRPLLLENITAYTPVISVAFEPGNRAEGEKLDEALARYVLEDPTLKVEIDESCGQRLVSGMGELHLEVLRDRIRREYRLEPRVGNPQVVCKESIRRSAEAEGICERYLGEVFHHGYVRLRVSPLARGQGNALNWLFDRRDWPEAWLDSVVQGITDSFHSGALRGFPLQDVQVDILALQRREGVSSSVGYHLAGVAAFKSALEAASPLLLEPVMQVEVVVPGAFQGAVLNLLHTRGGKITRVQEKGERALVTALAPMRELFGFSTRLRSVTQGRASLLMRFARFDSV
ncbi:MAG: elongation factor G [Deltaproteobacteria bacterium]|jgi:elongation factor G|nr:elongation factor G [Deltaproteobacteria bacterium]